jgi:hypothetical protein
LLAFFFGLFLVGVILKWNTITFGVAFMIVWGGIHFLLSKISFFKLVPLKCSQCNKYMTRYRRPISGGGDAIFFECVSCKRYIDTGISEGD